MMFGLMMCLIITPKMTKNHSIWTIFLIDYILIAVKFFEEPQLLAEMPVEYKDYMETTPAYFPFGSLFKKVKSQR